MSRDDTVPNAENSSALKQRISHLERELADLERQRSELTVKATMAEEQLRNFEQLTNSNIQHYQMKILELNKRIEASDLRNNRKSYYDDL